MSCSPALLPKINRDLKSISPRILPTIAISSSLKPPSRQGTALSARLETLSPNDFLGIDDAMFSTNNTPSIMNCGSRMEIKNPGTQKTILDTKTALCINDLVETTYKRKSNKHHTDVFAKKNIPTQQNLSRDHKIVRKVETMIKQKGLDAGGRDRLFESKLDVFNSVRTYVDTKKVFKDANLGQSSNKLPTDPNDQETAVGTANYLKADDYSLESPRTPTSFLFVEAETPSTGRKKSTFFSKNLESSPRIEPRDMRASVAGTINPNNNRDLEIRKLYEQLRESALQKFGPEIFEKAQKKLKDPKELELLEKKRQKEIAEMRKLQKELATFDLGNKLINSLSQNGRRSADAGLQSENVNQFDHYVESKMSEDEVVMSPMRRSMMPIVVVPPQEEAEEGKEAKLPDEEDNQIKLLKDLQQHKQKSGEAVKFLKEKLVSVQQEAATESPTLGSRSVRKSKYFNGTPLLPEDNSSPTFLITQARDSPMSARRDSRNLLLKNALKLDLETFTNESESVSPTEEKPPMVSTKTVVVRKSARNSTISIAASKDSPPTNFVRRQNRGTTSTAAASVVATQKIQLLGICNDINSLEAENKGLNKKVRASFREVEGSYAMMESVKGEDILKSPSDTGMAKSSSKLAASLALKIFLAKEP